MGFFAEDGVEVLKELCTSDARLDLCREAGSLRFIYQVCNFLFHGVVNLFVEGEFRLEPTSFCLPTLPFQLAELLRDTAEPGCRLPRMG